MITYKDCPNCDARTIHYLVRLCEVCEVSEGYEKRLEGMRGELELAHNSHNAAVAERDHARHLLGKVLFDDVVVKERNHARHLLGEVLAVLNGDGGHAVQELGWDEATKRGLARYYELRKRADCLVMYPCECTYPRDGQPDANCGTCHGLGAITKTESK